MDKARRYAIIVAGFAFGAFLAPFLIVVVFVVVAWIVEAAHL